jgi:leucine dehydrogenase
MVQPICHDPSADHLPEHLQMIDDPDSGAQGVIALHSTALGPAAGGCRLWHYADSQDAVNDAIRLARGMSYKNALAGLPFGGGKAVLRRPAGTFDRQALFRAFAEAVEALRGAYVTAEDVGTTVADMEEVARHTRHVAGLTRRAGRVGGDPSPWTAQGVFAAMQAAAHHALGRDLDQLTVAVQGVGHVGAHLCGLLARAGARLILADIDPARAQAVAQACGARIVPVDAIAGVEADVLAPCALGGGLNGHTIPRLRVALVCGGANNQLETEEDGHALFQRGIAYAPDYVVNAGGIINVAAEYLGETTDAVERRIAAIPGRVEQILQRAAQERRSSHAVADEMARRLIAAAQRVPA